MHMRGWARVILQTLVVATFCMVAAHFVFQAPPVFAAEGDTPSVVANLNEFGTATGLGNEDPRIIIARIIRVILGFLGIVAVILVMYGGWLWMTSGGDPGKVETAQKVLINAAIGTVIILSSLAITQYVLNTLLAATGTGGSGGSNAGPEILDPLSVALGTGIIEGHFPRRGDTDIARNVLIAVTFKEAIDPATVLDGFDEASPTAAYPVRTTAVQILEREETPLGEGAVMGSITADRKTFVFDPVELLGSPDEDIWYSVELSGRIHLADGSNAFTGRYADGYSWRFQTGTFVDVTPPQVTRVVPFASSTNPRNILVQVYYDEPVNPVSASGFLPNAAGPDFHNIEALSRTSRTLITGEWKLLNGYQTSEFVTDAACGTNSCGELIYCLPGRDQIFVTVHAADVGAEPPQAASIVSPNGVTDMYGNALDGDNDGVAEGQPADDVNWTFKTTDEIVLTPPQITSITPDLAAIGLPASNIALDQDIALVFDTPLSASTVNTDRIRLHSPSDSLWYVPYMTLRDSATSSASSLAGLETYLTLSHGIFSDTRLYGVEVSSGVRSIYQNCFTPSVSSSCVGTDANCCNGATQSAQCAYPAFSLPSP